MTLRAGSAHVGRASLVAAVTAASLAGGASHAASPVPAMDTPSHATRSQASARTATEPPRAGTVRGEAALKGWEGVRMKGQAPLHVPLPPGAWTATMETPPWAQASGASPAPVLGTLAQASIMGRPAVWIAPMDVSCASVHPAMQVRHGWQ